MDCPNHMALSSKTIKWQRVEDNLRQLVLFPCREIITLQLQGQTWYSRLRYHKQANLFLVILDWTAHKRNNSHTMILSLTMLQDQLPVNRQHTVHILTKLLFSSTELSQSPLPASATNYHHSYKCLPSHKDSSCQPLLLRQLPVQ